MSMIVSAARVLRPLAAGFLAIVASTAASSAAEVEIWTARDAQLGSLPIIAEKQGFLSSKGVDAVVKFVSSGNEIPAGMAGGTIPIAIASYTNPMSMASSGVPVQILAQTAELSGALQLTVRNDAGVATAADLNGKRLGMTRIPLMMSLLEKGCAAYGCDVSTFVISNMLPQDLVLAFERGDVDAVLTNEPWSIYMQRSGGKMLFSGAKSNVPGMEGDRHIDGIYASIFARPDFVEANPEVTKNILAAFVEAANWIEANPEEAAKVIGAEIDIPVDVVVGTLAKIDNNLIMTKEWGEEFNSKADELLKLGELPAPVTADKVFNPEPLRSVCDECVTFE